MHDELVRAQERIAHLEMSVEELNATVARQDAELRNLGESVKQLLLRLQELAEDQGANPAHEPPPHY